MVSNKAKSGLARAASLTPERRKEIAIKAVQERIKNPIIRATHGANERPLIIGDVEIPCFVLEDGRRVILQREMATAMGFVTPSATKLTALSDKKFLEGMLSSSTIESLNNPIKIRTPSGAIAHGYEAVVFVDMCESFLKAKDAGNLIKSQLRIASQCEILIRSFAKTGIIALIDEATGYQESRTKDALAKILEGFITRELQPYIKTFPIEFYKQLFRLRKVNVNEELVKNPHYFGHLTNNIIYKRLAPGVLDELKNRTPLTKSGNKAAKYFQSLSPTLGFYKLKEHIGSVITLMKLSDDYDDFMKKLDKIHPLFEISNLDQFEEHQQKEGI